MKTAVLFILIIFSFHTYSQKTIKYEICRTQVVDITAFLNYDASNKPIDTIYIASARDCRYPNIFAYFTLKRTRSLPEMYYMFKESQKSFKNEEVGTIVTHYGNRVSIERSVGIKIAAMYSSETYEGGYVNLGSQHFNKILFQIEDFCSGSGIKL